MDDVLLPPAAPFEYAGFWRRFNAYGIDATIVVIIAWLLDYLLPGNAMAQAGPDYMNQIAQLSSSMQSGQFSPAMMESVKQAVINSLTGGSLIGPDEYITITVSAIYNIFFIVGSWQATPGKHWLNCKVVNADSSAVTLKQSIVRHSATGISAWAAMVPCITIFWSREKLAPHDMIAKTRVVMRPKT